MEISKCSTLAHTEHRTQLYIHIRIVEQRTLVSVHTISTSHYHNTLPLADGHWALKIFEVTKYRDNGLH